MNAKLFFPICDNGMGLSRTSWAISMFAGLSALKGHQITLRGFSYPYPDGNMQLATAAFLESDADEMCVVDTDLEFRPDHLEMLLSHAEPLVFGLYAKKELGCQWPVIPLESNPDPFSAEGPLCEVACAPKGFMRVHRSVFETMRGSGCVEKFIHPQTGREQHEYWKTMQGGHSEDFRFCRMWRELGNRILIDKRIVVAHLGSASYPIQGTY